MGRLGTVIRDIKNRTLYLFLVYQYNLCEIVCDLALTPDLDFTAKHTSVARESLELRPTTTTLDNRGRRSIMNKNM